MKHMKKPFLEFKNMGMFLLYFSLFLFIVLSCSEVPLNPYNPSNVTLTTVLKSSSQETAENVIQDSIGHIVRVGFVCFMPKFIDSIELKIISNLSTVEKDTVFKIISNSTSYDTIWYNKSFSYGGLRTLQITTFIEDGRKLSNSAVISIDGPPNQRPMLYVIGSRNPAPNSPCTLSVNGIDNDVGQLLSYSVDGKPLNSQFLNHMFTWTPSASDTGTFNVIFRVTDNGFPPLYDSIIVPIVVDLSLPKPSKPLNIAVVERKAFTVSLCWQKSERVDNYQLFRSASKTTGFTFRRSIHDTVITDSLSAAAFYYYITAKNRTGDMSSDTILVSSINNSKSIWISDSFTININEGQAYLLSLSQQCKVPEGDSLTFKLVTDSLLYDTVTAKKQYSFLPSYTDSGSYSIFLIAKTKSLTDTFTLKMHVANINRPPVFMEDLPALSYFVIEKNILQIPFVTVDPDGDAVSYVVKSTNLPRQNTLEISKIDGLLKWISQAGDSGTYKIELVANDGVDSTAIRINVYAGKGNVPPVWKNHAISLSVKEAQSCTLNLAGLSTDPNSDTLIYTLLPGLPSGDTILNDRLYIYAPTYNDSGTYEKVKIVASDGLLYDTAGVILKVLNVNRAPVISGVKDMTVGPGVAVKCTVTVSDPDLDPTFLSSPTLPSGAMFDSLTGILSFPSPTSGDNLISFSVTDGKLVTIKNMVVTVSATAPPSIIVQPKNVSACAGQPVSFSINASGVGPLSYLWRKNGDAIVGQTSSTLVFASVNASDAGKFECVVSNSGGHSTSDSVILAVTLPSVSPTSAGVSANPSSLCLGSSTILTITSGSLGSDVVTWKWYTDRACTTLVNGNVKKTGVLIGTQNVIGSEVLGIGFPEIINIKNLNGSQIVVVPTVLGVNKYFVRAEGVCNTTFDSVQVTVNPIPNKPTSVSATPSTISVGDSVVLSSFIFPIIELPSKELIIKRTSTKWYTGSCGGTPVTGTTVRPGVTTTYYVRTENGTCSSACDSVTVTVK